jgi:RHS repeat-associated protein
LKSPVNTNSLGIGNTTSTNTFINPYRYGFSGKEKDDETFGNGDEYDYGFRIYESRLGKFLSVDPLSKEYAFNSPYAYAENTPISGIDLEGKEFYFSAGAAHDADKTGYIGKMLQAFNAAGIANTRDIKAHGSAVDDLLFTVGENSRTPADKITKITVHNYGVGGVGGGPSTVEETKVPLDWRISKTVADIKTDMKEHPVAKGSQFNLAGYSAGSVIMAQAALQLAEGGQKIDNLILIGSPVLKDSKLYKEILANKNIKNVIRIDIDNDGVKNVNKQGLFKNVSLLKTLFLDKAKTHPHYKYGKITPEGDKSRKELGETLKKDGVK